MKTNKIIYYGNYSFFIINSILAVLQIHAGELKGAGISLLVAGLNLFAVLTYKGE